MNTVTPIIGDLRRWAPGEKERYWGKAHRLTIAEIHRQRWHAARDSQALTNLLECIVLSIFHCYQGEGALTSADQVPAASRALIADLEDVLSKVRKDTAARTILLISLVSASEDAGVSPWTTVSSAKAVDLMIAACKIGTEETRSRPGRPRRHNLVRLVVQLGTFYHQQSGRRPAATEGGPFERFVQAVLSAEVLKAPADPRRVSG